MIINSLHAENVLKYERLALTELPGRGLIAVTGLNESGKSTIGETLCFALFGRTFSLAPEEIAKVIRWGQTRCSSVLDFTVEDGRYRVERYLDDAGNQGVRLSKADAEEPMVRGAEPVLAEVVDLIGFDYVGFIESFYLAQREIVAPHAHGAAVKAMAGIAPYEKLESEFANEIVNHHEAITQLERDLAQMEDERSTLNLQPERLPALWGELADAQASDRDKRMRSQKLAHTSHRAGDSLNTLEEAAEPILQAGTNSSYRDWTGRAERLDEGVQTIRKQGGERVSKRHEECVGKLQDYVGSLKARLDGFADLSKRAGFYHHRLTERLGEGKSASSTKAATSLPERLKGAQSSATEVRGSRGRARGLLIALVILAVLAWALVALMSAGVAGFQALSSGLADTVGPVSGPYVPMAVAAVLTLLALLVWIRSAGLGSRAAVREQERDNLETELETTRREAQSLENLETQPMHEALERMSGVRDQALANAADTYAHEDGVVLVDSGSLRAYREELDGLVREYRDATTETRSACDGESERLQEEAKRLEQDIPARGQAVREEQERHRQAKSLQRTIDDLEAKLDAERHQIEIRHLGRELLAGASQDVSAGFNTEVRNLVGDTLPRLTRGRYEHLQIDENLRVRVFSGAKRDFVDLDGISSGTQRQIMLAVRLALAHKLIDSAMIESQQFIFLDEPFAFFDEQRTRDSLDMLAQTDNQISQTWVVAQEFPQDAMGRFDMHIPCEHAQTELVASAAAS